MKVKQIWFREKLLVPQLQLTADKGTKKQLKALRNDILTLLTRQRFVAFAKQPNFLFDNQLNCLWLLYGFKSSPEEMFQHIGRLQVYAFRNWEIPAIGELKEIAGERLLMEHPRFRDAVIYSNARAKDTPGYRSVRVGDGEVVTGTGIQTILPIHRVAQRDVLGFIVAHSLVPRDIPEVEEKLKELYELTMRLTKETAAQPPPSLRALQQHLLEGDYLRARLPVLEPAYLSDMEKGLWELYYPDKPQGEGWVQVDLEEAWEARNPEQDIRQGVVAIDFGTSSTVVACREHGKTTLLRVGMSDLFKRPTPVDYQNPTVLEFLHLPNLLNAWNSEPFRPLTRWEDFHFSHEALAHYRENEADQRIVASMLTAIKQWPLEAEADKPLRITDQITGTELEIGPPATPMPVAGQPLATHEDDPFNPIEIYAYYLGLFINHRANGLFLEYYLTFPITYPRKVKEKILASFARGLMRSLPHSLAGSPHLLRFQVREEASEPAAYAACALEELGIGTTPQGTAYAVFDFGGGTTDFDFGLYRGPTPEEKERGYEKVIEHFGASGDMFLGGENLVANLVYLTFQENLELCREHHIPFSCPNDAEKFPGHEMFIDNSHVAQTNSALLMAKVRPVWESFIWKLNEKPGSGDNERRRRWTDYIGDAISQAIIDHDFRVDPETRSLKEEDATFTIEAELLNREREKVALTFTVDRNRLNHYLVARVGQGIQRFFIAMVQAFGSRKKSPEQVHILLAGNASRSPLVQSLFAALLQERMLGWEPPASPVEASAPLLAIRKSIPFPRFMVHRPPVGDPDDPYKPTAKTGVAIGLLKLIPGEPLLAVGPSADNDTGEAPFRHFVGRLREGLFKPALLQNGPYRQWAELGTPTRGVFVLVHTTSPQAALGNLPRGHRDLLERNIHLPPGNEGKLLFVRAVGPDQVEVALADDVEQIRRTPEKVGHQEVIDLGM